MLTVSEWAEQFRNLSSESSASPGKWYNYRVPYLVGIMDAFNDPHTETIVVQSSAQIGKSESLCNVIGYVISQNPAPVLLVLPTGALAESFVKDRFTPMVRDSEQLSKLVDLTGSKRKLVEDTLLHRSFPGGHFSLAGANSPASLSSRPIKILLCDEVDRFPVSFAAEGDVVSIARKRTIAFYNRKIFLTSTPTIKGASRIEFEFLQSDQRHYFVPCPHCGHFQILQLGKESDDYGLRWDADHPETAAYLCEHCHSLIPHSEKQRMLLRGEWRSTAEPSNKRTAGFHLNELYSPFVTWERLVENFLEARKSQDTLRTFVNTSLGETWAADDSAELEPSKIIERCENYTDIPDAVKVLTCGVDVQGDRLECEVVGFGSHDESWGIHREIIAGDPAQPAVWHQLDEFLKRKFSRTDAKTLPISCTAVDSGFQTDMVYKFCQPRLHRRIFAIKGVSGSGKPIIGKAQRTKATAGHIKVAALGVDQIKDIIYSHLAISEPSAGVPYMHFPATYPQEFFDQLTAEKAIVKSSRNGRAQRIYVKVRKRNEALDIRCYSYAALKMLHLDLDQLDSPFELQQADKTSQTDSTPAKAAQQKQQNDYGLQEIIKRMKNPTRRSFVNGWK